MTSPKNPASTRVVGGPSRPEPALGTWVLTAIAALLVAAGVLSVLPSRSQVRAAPAGASTLHERPRPRAAVDSTEVPPPVVAPPRPMTESSSRESTSMSAAARDVLSDSSVPAAAPDR